MSQQLIRGGLVYGHGYCDVLVEGNRIAAIAPQLNVADYPDAEQTNAQGCLLFPGLVNTHHHLMQSLLKAVPAGINQDLNAWLSSVPYMAWPHVTPEFMYAAARVGLAELVLSGCTTCADHHYLYEQSTSPELEQAIFRAADELGVRLVLCRGGGTAAGTHPGMKSAGVIPETLDQCLSRVSDTLKQFHNPAEDAMTRVVLAPTSLIHSTPREHLVEMAEFAKANQLLRHSHLLEVTHDEEVARQREGVGAVDYAADVGWLGDDVWYAHLVQCDEAAIAQLGASNTGIAHCPVSNSRLGAGIAPVLAMESAGVRISLGVDGSASAESGSMVNEMMQAWLIHRSQHGPDATRVDQVVRWASQAGAALLGFNELGALEVGKIADLAVFSLDDPRFLGVWEPQWAPVVCGEPITAQYVMVNGNWVVREGRVLGLDYAQLQTDTQTELKRLEEACL